ncbi:hypothetical protein N7534_005269 [Penicillium rubens]|nr:hypothetical protein N7534_005269 [Penicillium rubens]
MPARAHRRAPRSPRRRRQPPYPHAGGSLPMAPRGSGLALYAPLPKPPGKVAPFDPRPPAVRRTGESVKSPYLPPPSRVFTDPLQSPGSLSPGKVPPPRACTPRLAPRARPPASRAGFASTSPPPPHPPVRPTPPPRQLAPHAPLPRAAKPRRPPLAPGLGGGGPPVAHGYVGTGVPGVVPRGSPCQGPHRNIPRHPGTPTQRDAATLAGPHSLSPGPLGPGRFYTDSPTPFGV